MSNYICTSNCNLLPDNKHCTCDGWLKERWVCLNGVAPTWQPCDTPDEEANNEPCRYLGLAHGVAWCVHHTLPLSIEAFVHCSGISAVQLGCHS